MRLKSRTGKFRAAGKISIILAPALWAGMAIGAGCKIAKIAELPVTMIDMHPMVKAQINGVDASFLADSGAFYSMLSPAAAAEFKLNTSPAPFGLFVSGVGGGVSANAALRTALQQLAAEQGVELLIPPIKLCTDNAAMAALAVEKWRLRECASLDLDAVPNYT